MVLASTPATETSLRRPPQDALTLRIVGGRRDGQSVRLTARKCTIGADRHCTLRIRAYGVRPIHCLIVRGARAMVVRRWSGDTLLNNHTFSDAPLIPGDRIRVGPIELEVVDSEADSACQTDPGPSAEADPSQTAVLGETPAAQSPPAPAAWRERLLLIRRSGHARCRRLVSQLRQAREQATQAAQLVKDQETLAQRTREAAADVERRQRSMRRQEEQWEATHRQAEAHLTRRQNEVQTQVEAFEREQAQWQQTCESFESERWAWETQRDQAAQSMRQREEQLERREQQLESERNNLQAQFDELTGQLDSLPPGDPREREVALRQREQAVESRQEALAEEIQRFERSCQERQTALDARQADVERQLTQQLETLKADRANFERQREELIESSQNLDAQRRQWRARVEKTEMELTRRQRELDHLSSTLELERGELHEWQHELDRLRRPAAPREMVVADGSDASDPDLRETLPVGTTPLDPSASKSIASDPPATAEDVFARLRELATTPAAPSVPVSKDEPRAPAQGDSADSSPGTAPAASPAGPWPQPDVSAAKAPQEASMEGYMARLMEHTGGRSEALVPGLSPSGRPPSSPPNEPPPSSSPEAPPLAAPPLPMQPRHVAPEMSSNIAAMRELANFHARSAIERHQSRRRWTLAATGKLIVASFAAIVGITALLWPDGPHDTWYYAGAISALTVAMFWGLQCALLARSIYRVKRSWLPQSEAITPEESDNAAVGRLPNVPK